MENRQTAYEKLIELAEKQGYVTFDNIMDCADEYSLPIQDFDWLSNSITTRGILVYSEAPTRNVPSDEDDFDDFAQSDYDAVYTRIIELSPSLESFVSYVRMVIPPQRGEIRQLKYQIVDGNAYARERMIEMHLRLALRVALQRAETYDMDIEDAIGYACIGLVIAVDKYDPDTSGAFASYASLWMIQNISRVQSTQRPLIYYPVHQKEGYFAMYPVLKAHDCIGCERLNECAYAISMVQEKNECSPDEAKKILDQMIPDAQIEDLLELSENCDEEDTPRDTLIDALLSNLSEEIILPDEDALSTVQKNALKEEVASVLSKLTPKEERVLRLRYGFDGHERTLEEVGAEFNVTRERIRQIEGKALRKLGHRNRQICGRIKRPPSQGISNEMAVDIFIMVYEFYIPGVRSPGGKIPPRLHPSGSDQARCAGAKPGSGRDPGRSPLRSQSNCRSRRWTGHRRGYWKRASSSGP